MRRRVWTAAVGMLAAAMVACGGGDDAADQMPGDTAATGTPPGAPPAAPTVQLPEGVTQDMVTAGQEIFRGAGNCFTCHADDGTGTALAPNLRDSEWINIPEPTFDNIMTVVRTGVATPQQHPAPMPAMGGAQLSDEQVRQVSAYVYTLAHGG